MSGSGTENTIGKSIVSHIVSVKAESASNCVVETNDSINKDTNPVVTDSNGTNPVVTDTKTNEAESKDNKTVQPVLKTSRELKSILALSKEAKMETNIAYKRKSIEPATLAKISSSPVSLTDSQSRSSESDENNKQIIDKDDYIKMNKRKRDSSNDFYIGGVGEELIKRNKKTLKSDLGMNKPNKDLFCWRCHRDGVGISCETCPRSFHRKCLKQSIVNPEHWPCPECVAILKAESTKTRSPSLKGMSLDHLCGLLKFAHKRMIQCSGSEPFIKPVDEKEFPNYRTYIVQPMDLICLENNIKENLYGSTHAFEADAKWILHNSIIFNGFQSKLTSTAKAIIKICKQEMSEIENCPSCYLNANTKKNSWFIEVCPKPHLLLWAKLKGFPYWPAKAMRTNSSGMIDVRFFGAHDRAWIPLKDCFLFSRRDPNSNKQMRNDINSCVKELEIHIECLKKEYGEFNYAPYRTLIDPENETTQLQLMLPSYKPDPSVNYDNNKKSETAEEKEKIDVPEGIQSDKTSTVKSNKKDVGSKTDLSSETHDDVDKEDMVGYGTDDECDDKIDNVRRQKLTNNTSIEESDDDKSGQQYDGKEDQFETQVETSSFTDSNSNKGRIRIKCVYSDNNGKMKNVSRQSFDGDQTPKRLSTEDFLEVPPKLSRRNSDQSIKSDSSRLSSISDKISHIDISENMEITLGNDETGNVSISENVSSSDMSDSSKSEIVDLETKRKHIVQVNIENKEFTISPKNKLKIADRLIKKFAEEFRSTDETECDLSKKTEPILINNTIEDATYDDDNFLYTDGKSNKPDLVDKVNKIDPNNKIESSNLNDKYMDEVNVRNIIHSSLNDLKPVDAKKVSECEEKKRKASVNEIDDQPFQNKLLKLVADADLSNCNFDKSVNTLATKECSEDPNAISIKNEPLTDNESDTENIEAKKKYLSALNISEKPTAEDRNKSDETQAPPKPFKIVDNLTRVIDSVALHYSKEHDGEEITLNSKKAQLKPLAKVPINKSKARKSFSSPVQTQIIKKDAKINKPDLKVNIIESYVSPQVSKKPDLQPSNLKIVSQPITALPPNQTFMYTTNVGNSILISQPIVINECSDNESQNYIPQSNVTGTKPIEPKTNEVTSSSVPLNNVPSLAPLSEMTAVVSENRANEMNKELTVLGDVLPGNVTKGMSDLFSQQPPKLKPRPPSILSTNYDEGLPSSAGPVTSKINSISHRLGDYFRGMLIETLQDLGSSDNQEALITKLKLENETLKQKHATEMLEVKKNVCSILKDMQKSISEERERIIEETRAACEAETIKRVEEAKSKQWCANCFNEAQFYCCWNTSYCDYPCQQKHWPKHMSKCIQNTANSRNNSESPAVAAINPKPQAPLVLRQTTAPKGLVGKKFVATKPTKVFVNRNGSMKGPFTHLVKSATTSHLTLVESTPGNYELVGSGPIAVGGKLVTSTTIMGKIKSGNVITVTSPSNTNTTENSTISRQVGATANNNTPFKSSLNGKTV